MSAALSFMVIGSVFAENAKQSSGEKDYKNSTKKYNEFIKANGTDQLKQAQADRIAAGKEYDLARIEVMKSDLGNAAVAEAYEKSFEEMKSGKKDKAQYEAAKKSRGDFEDAWRNNYKKYGQDPRLKAAKDKKDGAQKAIESAESDIRKNNPDAAKLWDSSIDAKKDLKKAEKIAKNMEQKAKKHKKPASSKKSDSSKKQENSKKQDSSKKLDKKQKPVEVSK